MLCTDFSCYWQQWCLKYRTMLMENVAYNDISWVTHNWLKFVVHRISLLLTHTDCWQCIHNGYVRLVNSESDTDSDSYSEKVTIDVNDVRRHLKTLDSELESNRWEFIHTILWNTVRIMDSRKGITCREQGQPVVELEPGILEHLALRNSYNNLLSWP